jgi:hypothetical protein
MDAIPYGNTQGLEAKGYQTLPQLDIDHGSFDPLWAVSHFFRVDYLSQTGVTTASSRIKLADNYARHINQVVDLVFLTTPTPLSRVIRLNFSGILQKHE